MLQVLVLLTLAATLGLYGVSKAALIYLTRQLAYELGPKVRVNALAPGLVRTRLAKGLWELGDRHIDGDRHY